MKIPSPKDLKAALPRVCQNDFRAQARAILQGNDHRFVVVVGPCSVHDPEPFLEYVEKLKNLAKKTEDELFIVLRAFVEKARTAGGWRGYISSPDLATGLCLSRDLLRKIDLPLAMEFVDPFAAPYLEDLITWGFIGARTVTSQVHRQMASSFSFPIGFKNSLDGSAERAANGVLIAQSKGEFFTIDDKGGLAAKTASGNPFAHIVLRGSCTHPNYDPFSINTAVQMLKTKHLAPRLMIDCAHGNSGKNAEGQCTVFQSILKQKKEGAEAIFGLMLESFLKRGHQPHTRPFEYGVSVTDPCLDWDATEELLLECASQLQVGWR